MAIAISYIPWILAALGVWVGYLLVKMMGRMLLRLDSLESQVIELAQRSASPPSAQTPPAPLPPKQLALGSAAPGFELFDLEGKSHNLAEFAGQRVLVIFFNPHCGFCTRMADSVAALPLDVREKPLPVLVSTGPAEDNRSMVQEYGLKCPLLLQKQMEVATQYGAHGTPMAYVIDEQGKIASGLLVGGDPILEAARGPSQAAAEAQVPAASPPNAADADAKSQPCGKHNGKKPCAKCASSDGQSPANDREPSDYGLLVVPETVDADFAASLAQEAAGCQRLVVTASAGHALDEAAFVALRRFLRQHSEWSVAQEGKGRFLVLSRDPRDHKAMPSKLKMAANFARAIATHLGDGSRRVTTLQLEQRLEECALCDRRSGDNCSACGCDLLTKAGWRTSECPLGKWKKLASVDPPTPANTPSPQTIS